MKIMFSSSGFELFLSPKTTKQKRSFIIISYPKNSNLWADNGVEFRVELVARQQMIKIQAVNVFLLAFYIVDIIERNILYIIINRWTSPAAVCCCHNKFHIHIVKYFYESSVCRHRNTCISRSFACFVFLRIENRWKHFRSPQNSA
jgi:hypothetical protein